MPIGGGTRVGSFTARLGLDASDYARGALEADGYNQLLGRSFSTFVANPLLGTLNLIKSSGQALGSYTLKQLELYEALERQAAASGLSAENIQALRLQYQRATGDTQGFDQAINALVRRLGRFREFGSGAGREVLESLGIDPSDPRLDDVNSFLDLMIEKLQSLPDAQAQAAIGTGVLGDEALKLVQVLVSMGIGLDGLREKFAGQIVPDETISILANANTLVGTFRQNIVGLRDVLAAGLLEGFFGEFLDGASEEQIDSFVRKIAAELIPAMRDLGQEVGETAREVRDLVESLTELAGNPAIRLLRLGAEGVTTQGRITNAIIEDGFFDGLRNLAIERALERAWEDNMP